ncbi:MAG: aminotransferase class I/II-fold pyridoxal phosphate-dependent enzyme [Ilumatobacteraceae bacterium]
MTTVTAEGFVPPPYPHDRLDGLRRHTERFASGAIDLSIGTPFDAPDPAVVRALSTSDAERGYPASIGSLALRSAASRWMNRRFSIDVDPSAVAACVGSKEFVVTVPQWLRLRSPDRDTVLYPAVSYPSYEMGSTLAGCRAVAVAATAQGHLDLEGPARTILEHGLEGVIAVHSLSKRSNLAGARVAFYSGDPDLVHYLSEVRKHAGLMMPGPVQAAGVVALDDDAHVEVQRDRYRDRLATAARALSAWSGVDIALPAGGFYLWFEVGDAWGFAERLAVEGGCLVSPGEFYGDAGRSHVRVAVVTSMERLELLAERLSGGGDR